jgi:hypothetical protein
MNLANALVHVLLILICVWSVQQEDTFFRVAFFSCTRHLARFFDLNSSWFHLFSAHVNTYIIYRPARNKWFYSYVRLQSSMNTAGNKQKGSLTKTEQIVQGKYWKSDFLKGDPREFLG